MGSWIPSKQSDLLAFLVNFSTLITATPATYGLTAPDAVSVAALVATAQAAYTTANTLTSRTPAAVNAKDLALAEATAAVRVYGKVIKANNGVADASKVALGIHLDDATPTVIPPPSTNPILSIVGATPGVLTVRYSDANTPDKRAKPAGVLALELFAAASSTVITDPTSLPFVRLATKQPLPLATDPAERGKTIYVAGRWVNRKGEPGPWSPIIAYIAV